MNPDQNNIKMFEIFTKIIFMCGIVFIVVSMILKNKINNSKYKKHLAKVYKYEIINDDHNERYGLLLYYKYNLNDKSFDGCDVYDSYSSMEYVNNMIHDIKNNYNNDVVIYYNKNNCNESILNFGISGLIFQFILSVGFGLICTSIFGYYMLHKLI